MDVFVISYRNLARYSEDRMVVHFINACINVYVMQCDCRIETELKLCHGIYDTL